MRVIRSGWKGWGGGDDQGREPLLAGGGRGRGRACQSKPHELRMKVRAWPSKICEGSGGHRRLQSRRRRGCGGGAEGAEEDDGAFDDRSASIIQLSNGLVLYMRHVSRFLALVCLMRQGNLERKGLIDYNVEVLKEALKEVLAERTSRTPRPSNATSLDPTPPLQSSASGQSGGYLNST